LTQYYINESIRKTLINLLEGPESRYLSYEMFIEGNPIKNNNKIASG